MSGKKLLVVGLAVVIALSTLLVVACGGDDGVDPKVAMQQALDKVEADVAGLMESVPTATGADLKQALIDYESDWDALVAACEGLDGADATEAQKMWDDMEQAVNALGDDDQGAAMLATLGGPGLALQGYVTSLRELVGPSPSAETDSE